MAHPRLDHGLIGNGRVLGLVAPTGSLDWLCMPRFDSPSIFARILDEEHGGRFAFQHADTELRGESAYVPNTNVLRTVFRHADACWELLDFAPRLPEGLGVSAPLQVTRLLRPLRGSVRLRTIFDPRPDYGRAPVHRLETTHGVAVLGGAAPLHLQSNVPMPYVLAGRDFLLDRPTWFTLTWGLPDAAQDTTRVLDALDLTIRGWRAWASTCALPTFAPAEVLRSALCLKLCAYEDTGAIIAAATTSIPEAMGTERTWDYRYCWLRDAAFVVEALRRLGHLEEGRRFIRYLRDVAEAGPLQPLYGIGGERALDEHFLPHLAGFGGNGFVRVGNAACLQRQNDLMGELILCLETLLGDPRTVHEDPHNVLPLIERLVEEAIAAAPTPDTSIWEFRTFLRPYTFSRAMCWTAIDRGARLAERLQRADLARRWREIADREQAEVLARGWNAQAGMFTQTLDGALPDASNLLLATIGLVDARDPRFVQTVAASERLLVDRGFMLRYRNDDDFGPVRSAFTICSFWWAEALAMTGNLDRAVEVFQSIARHANPVGLFSEDVDPSTGALLGNFPQAYTHVGLIHAAMTIGRLLEARDGAVRAWR
jgi:GH15 family glucan-1,4-alpha-glucosidase